MTTTELHLFNAAYFILLVLVAFFTRATARRVIGALAGAAVAGGVALGNIAVGERMGWWHMAITWEPYFLTLLLIDFTLGAFIFLFTWRLARRFGGRGLTACVLLAAILGPPRDYWYLRRCPAWGAYGPGVAPFLAVAGTYIMFVLVGHGVMRLIAGPASADPLARPPRAGGASSS